MVCNRRGVSKVRLKWRYSQEKFQLKQMFRGFTKATESMKKFLGRTGVDDEFLESVTLMTLGYELNDADADKILFYKFRKEIFLQILKEYGINDAGR